MRVSIFLFLYGALILSGGFLVWFFGTMTVKRHRVIEHPWYQDRYLIITLGVFLFAVGNLLQFAGRLVGNAYHGLSPILLRVEAIPIATGLVSIMLASWLFVFLADLETDPADWKWLKRGAVVVAVWAVLTFFISKWVPLKDVFDWPLL